MAEAQLRRMNAFDESLPVATEEPSLQPKIGDRIMVLRQPWLDYILEGSKTMELRSRKFRAGAVWLGMGGKIYGRVRIVEAVTLTADEFRAREPEHRWPADKAIPYEAPCGLVLDQVARLPAPLPYWRPGAAIGWNVYRTEEADLPMKSSGVSSKKRKKSENAV